MKKSLLALAVLTSVSGVASAQSSVTVFGIVDVAARYIDNGGDDRYLLGSDGNASSRLGFRGIEDLGGGLKAGFWLESAINPDRGTSNEPDTGATERFNENGRFWHRRSTVSLIGGFGELRLGRDTLPTWTAFADFDPFSTVGVGDRGRTYTIGSLPTGVAVDTRVRGDNAVSYFLPALGGVYGNFTVAAGEGTLGKKYIGGRIGFASGPLNITGAYSQTEATEDEDFKVAVVSGWYDIGPARLILSYQETDFDNRKDTQAYIAGTYKIGAGTIKASYASTRGKDDIDGRDADHFALGYVHDLSKRTALYATVGHIKNDGPSNFTVREGGVSLVSGAEDDSTGVDIGIRHSF